MRQQLSARPEEALETWQLVAEQLIREPVREAVREALADEGVGRRASTTGGRSGGGSPDGGGSLLTPKLLVPLFGLAAAMLYARHKRNQSTEEEIGPEAGERAATTAGPSAPRTERGATPAGGTEEGEGDRESDAEGADEGATARS